MSSKICIVTGASSGIGFETAKLLAQNGEKVYAAARRLEKMKPLEAYGVIPVETDVTRDSDLIRLTEKVLSENGRIDVVVNNAGYGLYGAVETVSPGAAREQFDVNFFACARLIQLVAPEMRKNGSGLIVNISSVAGIIYAPLGTYYHASKHAVEGLSDCLRLELAPFGVKVAIVEPGLISTSWNDIMFDNLEKDSENTAYSETAQGIHGMYAGFSYSEPSVVAKTVCKAVYAKHPKRRYRTGKYSHLFVIGHRLLPNAVFDAAMRQTVIKGRRFLQKRK